MNNWQVIGNLQKLWARDAMLWTGADEDRWLGWRGLKEDQLAHLGQLRTIAAGVRRARFTDAVLLGMGRPSLAPRC